MANTRTGNVIYVDTTASFEKAIIRAVKYIGNASGTAVISNNSKTIWQESGTNNLSVDEICAVEFYRIEQELRVIDGKYKWVELN